MNPRALHGGIFLLRGSLAARNDRTGVAHALALRRRYAGDVADNRLSHMRSHVFGGFFLGGAPDLTDYDHRLGLRVLIEQLQGIDKAGTDNRVAADADAGALSEARIRCLKYGLVGQRAGARNDAHAAGSVDIAWHDTDLAFTWSDNAWTVGTDK